MKRKGKDVVFFFGLFWKGNIMNGIKSTRLGEISLIMGIIVMSLGRL